MAGRLVTIATFDQAGQAHVAKNALEAAGIRAAVVNEETMSVFGQISTALGGIKVQVFEEDEERAVGVLDEKFEEGPLNEADLAAQAEAEAPEDANEAAERPAALPSDPAADSYAREKDARFALLAVCFGFCIPAGHLLAVVMIMQAFSGPGALSRRGRNHVYAALILLFAIYMPLLILLLYLRNS